MYWITRLSQIHDALCVTFAAAFIIAAIIGTIILIFSYEEEDRNWLNSTKKHFIVASAIVILSGIGLIFVPKTSEALLIYGVGTTIDYVDNNDTIKQLPDKAVQALDKYLDSLNKDNKNESD